MLQEEDGILAGEAAGMQKPTLAVIVICAALSVFFINTGFMSLFYLAPLGYAVLTCGSIWLPFFATAGAYTFISIVMRFILPDSSGGLFIGIFYFTAIFLCFIWIMDGGKSHIRTAYRFILASAAGAIAFLFLILGGSRDSVFNATLLDMAEMVSSVVVSSSEADAVTQSALQMVLTPENILEMSKIILLRGGAVFSIFFMFFINRHIALLAFRLIKKQRNDRGLVDFFAPSQTIWVLSGSIALILLARLIKTDLLNIIAWNVFVVCAILFLAQGAGILIYFLSRRTGAFRLFVYILIVFLIISPGLNTVALAALLLLGIAENWLPFRLPKQGQASTPGL